MNMTIETLAVCRGDLERGRASAGQSYRVPNAYPIRVGLSTSEKFAVTRGPDHAALFNHDLTP